MHDLILKAELLRFSSGLGQFACKMQSGQEIPIPSQFDEDLSLDAILACLQQITNDVFPLSRKELLSLFF